MPEYLEVCTFWWRLLNFVQSSSTKALVVQSVRLHENKHGVRELHGSSTELDIQHSLASKVLVGVERRNKALALKFQDPTASTKVQVLYVQPRTVRLCGAVAPGIQTRGIVLLLVC
jgi:hypothetical protein